MNKTHHDEPDTVPIIVSWIGNTKLTVMAECGNDEERAIAIRIIKDDKAVDDKTIEDKLREMDLKGASFATAALRRRKIQEAAAKLLGKKSRQTIPHWIHKQER